MRNAPILITCAMLLGGCGGGGGGGGGVPPIPAATFTGFSNVPKPGTAEMSGITVESTYTADPTTFAVKSMAPAQNGVGTLSKTFDSSGAATAAKVTGALSSLSVSNDPRSMGGFDAVGAADSNNFILSSGTSQGFEYQSFGIWETGRLTGSGAAGAISAGAITAGAAIPKSGTATFSGFSLGAAVDAGGTNYATASVASVTADFGARTLALNTMGTQKTNMINGLTSSAPELNFSGSMSYSSATNSFSGPVATSGGYNGTSVGRFYGPAASELGGTFNTKGTGLQSYAGAYGAKR